VIVNNEIPEPFESYSGEGPYVFVSYAHDDQAQVYAYMREFKKVGVNIWYDEGIPAASEWVEEIAHAIKKSSLLVVFVSPRSVNSKYVKSEVGFALSEDKYILSIYLEDTDVPPGLALCLQQFQSINLSDKDWIKTACSTMLEKLNFSFTEIKEEVEEEPNILDPGIELWKLWENVWNTQLDRGTNRFKQDSVRTTAKIPNDSPVRRVNYDKPLTPSHSRKIPKSPGRGKTRHPLALGVSVDKPKPVQDQEQEKYYEDPGVGTFSWIPGGQLSIVVPYVDETRVVKVGEGFWLSQLTVTQDFYTRIMGSNPSYCDPDYHDPEILNNMGELPVNNVSWLDAVSFCKAITIMGKNQGTLLADHEYRLPTEVEWEYACRAGTTTDYYFGDNSNELHMHAWYKANSGKTLHPVGLKKPNPWKLYDMYGNVREWVSTSFQNALLNDSEQDEFRISRGGGYMKSAIECQSSSRSTNSLTVRYRNLGFRVVLARVPTV
jgi:hypothetical protein